jgi:tetratricopeptide (TPR) repeat protein
MLSQDHQGAQQFLADLPTENRQPVLHLLSCTRCQRLAAKRLVLDALGARLGGGPAKKSRERQEARDVLSGPQAPGALSALTLPRPEGEAPDDEHDAEWIWEGWPLGWPGRRFVPAPEEPVTGPDPALGDRPEPALPAGEGAAQPAEPRLPERQSPVSRLNAAEKLVIDLLRLPPGESRHKVLEEPACHNLNVVWMLLYHGQLASVSGKPDAAEVAELAVAAARRVTPSPLHHHHPLMHAALARAAREWTRCGDEAMAEEHYASLGAMLSPGAIGTCERDRATFCQGLAQLRWRQGRLDEAAALFQRAVYLWMDDSDDGRATMARAQLALVLLDSDSGDGLLTASRLLPAAHTLLREEPPTLRLRVALALAFCLTAIGEREQAARVQEDADQLILRVAKPPASAAPGASPESADDDDASDLGGGLPPLDAAQPAHHVGEALLWRWWQARIVAVGGQPGEGIRQLDTLRIDLLDQGSLAEAAGVTVDLVEVCATLGRQPPRGLGEDLVTVFGQRPAGAFAGRLRQVEELSGESLKADVHTVIAALRTEVWGLRGAAPERPPAIRPVADLVDAARAWFE